MKRTDQQRRAREIKGRRREIAGPRLLWRPVRITNTGALPYLTAVMLVAGLYGIGWLYPVLGAIISALMPPMPSTTIRTAWSILGDLIPSAAFILVGFAVLQMLARITQTPPATLGVGMRQQKHGWLASIAVYLMAMTAMQAKDLITHFLESLPGIPEGRDYPWSRVDSPEAGALSVYDSAIGGAVEEFIVLAVPVVALRATGARWRIILPVAVLLRFAFHVYYGPTAYTGILVWAFATACLYLACGRIWPLFFAHATNNAVASLYMVMEQQGKPGAETFASVAVTGLYACAGLGLMVAGWMGSGILAARRQHAHTPA